MPFSNLVLLSDIHKVEKNLKGPMRISPPRSTSRKVGNPPGLDWKLTSVKLRHPFWFTFGYSTEPTNVPPYMGTPKFPIAHSYVPFNDEGAVTLKLFFSTTNLPTVHPNNKPKTHNKRLSFVPIFFFFFFFPHKKRKKIRMNRKNWNSKCN